MTPAVREEVFRYVEWHEEQQDLKPRVDFHPDGRIKSTEPFIGGFLASGFLVSYSVFDVIKHAVFPIHTGVGEQLAVLIARKMTQIRIFKSFARLLDRTILPVLNPTIIRPLRKLWVRPGSQAIIGQLKEGIGMSMVVAWHKFAKYFSNGTGRFVAGAAFAAVLFTSLGLVLPVILPALHFGIGGTIVTSLAFGAAVAYIPFFRDRWDYQKANGIEGPFSRFWNRVAAQGGRTLERAADNNYGNIAQKAALWLKEMGAKAKEALHRLHPPPIVLPKDPGSSLKFKDRPFHELNIKEAIELRKWLIDGVPIDPSNKRLERDIHRLDRVLASTILWSKDDQGRKILHVTRPFVEEVGPQAITTSLLNIGEKVPGGLPKEVESRFAKMTPWGQIYIDAYRQLEAKKVESTPTRQEKVEADSSRRLLTKDFTIEAQREAPRSQSTPAARMAQSSGEGIGLSLSGSPASTSN